VANQKYSIGVRRVELVNASDNPVKLDEITRAVTTIEYEHHEIHAGSMYEAQVIDTNMADNASINICFKTPNTAKWLHMLPEFSAKVAGSMFIIENATWEATSGTVTLVRNRNRNSVNTSDVKINATSGVFCPDASVLVNASGAAVGAGSVIHQDVVFGTKQSGGGTRGAEEYVLKQDTKYAFIFKADGATNGGELELNWYEHTTKTN